MEHVFGCMVDIGLQLCLGVESCGYGHGIIAIDLHELVAKRGIHLKTTIFDTTFIGRKILEKLPILIHGMSKQPFRKSKRGADNLALDFTNSKRQCTFLTIQNQPTLNDPSG